jgi:hypothetical protein
MATPLSPEVRDIIVAQLPRPEPKLVPLIFFYVKENGGRIYISKALSEKEALLILDANNPLTAPSEPFYHHDDLSWSMRFDEYGCLFYFVRACMLGWDYATDADRRY